MKDKLKFKKSDKDCMVCASEQTKVLVSGQKYVSLNLKAQNFTELKPFSVFKVL